MTKQANPKGELTFELEGRRHTLAFSVNAIIEAEEAFDIGLAQIGPIIAGGINVPQVRAEFEKHLAAADIEPADAGRVVTAVEPFLEWVAQLTAKGGGTRFKHLRTLFRCALVDEMPDLTDQEAGRMMGALGLDNAAGLITRAFAAAFDEESGSGRPTAQPATNRRQRRSTAAGTGKN